MSKKSKGALTEGIVDDPGPIEDLMDRALHEITPLNGQTADPANGPAALGWVVWPAGEGRGGLIRRKVRLPMSIVEAYAIGPATSPDLRSTVAEKTATEMRRDAFALELDRAARGER